MRIRYVADGGAEIVVETNWDDEEGWPTRSLISPPTITFHESGIGPIVFRNLGEVPS